MKLILFANFFPCKRAEPFLKSEFNSAARHASEITTFTLYGRAEDSDPSIMQRAKCLVPVLPEAKNKKMLFAKGLFNPAPFGFHLNEFFTQKVFLSPAKLYWWFVSLLVTRAALSSEAYRDLKTYLLKNPDTLLYFYWGDNLCWTLPYLQKDLKQMPLKSVVRFHGSDLYEEIKASYAPLRKLVLKHAAALYTISEYGRKYLSDKYPDCKEKINVARLGVDDQGLNPFNPQKKVVLSVSNLVPVKRVHLIFNALQVMKEELEWHHFGDGPQMAMLKELTAQTRHGLKIFLHGHVSHSTLDEFLKTNSVSVFVNTSSSEGVPVSVMEAFSYGIPVVATAVGGTPELVNSSNGLLLKKDFSNAELAATLATFLNAETTRMEPLRKEARSTYERLSSSKNFDDFYLGLREL